MKLVTDQEALRSKCYHPSGVFVEFPLADVGASIPECFEKIVRKFPERLAVNDGDRAFTYEELNQAANRHRSQHRGTICDIRTSHCAAIRAGGFCDCGDLGSTENREDLRPVGSVSSCCPDIGYASGF